MLRVGVAEVVAYRAEFVIWILTTNMPLVMLALWSAVAADGPVGRFGSTQFVAYYLATLIVRLLTSSWVVWQINMDIRSGALATRLLRPVHPLLAYGVEHVAAVPLRVVVSAPLVVVLLYNAGDVIAVADPVIAAVLAASLVGAWLLMFLTMVMIGTLAMYMDSAIGLFEVWLGVHAIFSGYLVPIELLPAWVGSLARVLPFRYMLAFPVETLIGLRDRAGALTDLAVQWGYVAALLALTAFVWRTGMRRFITFGG